MSNKYEVDNVLGYNLGDVTKYKAEKAVFYGIAKRSSDINRKAIYTECGCMEIFEQYYKEAQKENSQRKTECWKCGAGVKVGSKSKIPFCASCKEDNKREFEEDSEQFSRLRSKLMFGRALKILENQQKFIHICKYKEAAEALEEYVIENYTKFDSAHEMVAAMELMRSKVKIIAQSTVAGRRVDFILKEEKIVMEVDGFLHKNSQQRDYSFDAQVIEELGSEWEIVRIPTKYIESNVSMIYEAVMNIKIYKQKIRKQNNGILPDFYSNREEIALRKILG